MLTPLLENPCQRCDSNRIKCKYNDKPARSRAPKPTSPASATQEIKHRKPSSSPPTQDAPKIDPLDSGTLWISNKKLHKIAFKNQLYETLKFKSLKTRRYGLSLPPLLVGFFDTTSQSTRIWSRLIELLNQMDTAYIEELEPIKSNIVEEAFRLFVTHNLVYGAFIHTQLLSFVLDSNAMLYYYMRPTESQQQQHSPPQSSFSPRPSSASASALNHRYLPYFSIIIYSILAITFLSAYLVLPNTNCSIPSETLYLYSHVFYREAHRQFLETCFPTATTTPITDTEPMEMMFLVQASILLAHFQCQAISEEQAYMTIRIGLDFAQRCSLAKDLVLQDNQDQDMVDALLISLDSWYAWLSFYLGKPYSERESIGGKADPESNEVRPLNTADSSPFSKKSKEQQWALHVTDVYTLFLKDILLKSKHQNTSFSAIKVIYNVFNETSELSGLYKALYRII